jgi:MFS family permease
LILYYLHLVLNSSGITDSKTQLIINGCVNINGVIWGNFFSPLVDKIGRRPLFLWGTVGMFCAFTAVTIMTGINTGQNFANPSVGHATIAMILIFGAFYKMPGVAFPSYTAEVAPYDLRAKAFVITGFGDALANLFSGYTNPIALAAIGWKYYIVWCCVLLINFLIMYFFYPETKNLSLEEVEQMFDGSAAQNKLTDEEVPTGKAKDNVEIRERETSKHVENAL